MIDLSHCVICDGSGRFAFVVDLGVGRGIKEKTRSNGPAPGLGNSEYFVCVCFFLGWGGGREAGGIVGASNKEEKEYPFFVCVLEGREEGRGSVTSFFFLGPASRVRGAGALFMLGADIYLKINKYIFVLAVSLFVCGLVVVLK